MIKMCKWFQDISQLNVYSIDSFGSNLNPSDPNRAILIVISYELFIRFLINLT